MTTTDPRARLNEIKARAEAATEGPWDFQHWGGQNQNGDYAESILFDGHGETLVYGLPDADGEWAAHARTDNPAMAAALTALLDLHSPIERRDGPVCDHCLHSPQMGAYPYPCPTVIAITDEMGGDRG